MHYFLQTENLFARAKVDKLISSCNQYVFLSPHLDDAILSCGMILSRLSDFKKDITIISIFTQSGSKPYSLQANSFMNKSGYVDAQHLFKERKKEDELAVGFYGGKYLHLDYIDAAWRQNKAGEHVYKSEKSQFSGVISDNDKFIVRNLFKKISIELRGINDLLIFAPLGIGGHVDHVIAREVAKKLRQQIIFWQDYPYNRSGAAIKKFFSNNVNFKHCFTIFENRHWRNKSIAIQFYKSQLNLLFPEKKVQVMAESYYVLKDLISSSNL